MFGEFKVGDIVKVHSSKYKSGIIRRIVKIHHSGALYYLEAYANERQDAMYFPASKLKKVIIETEFPSEELQMLVQKSRGTLTLRSQ